LKEYAQAYLDDAAASALYTRQDAEIDRLQSENAAIKNELAELRPLMDRLYNEIQAMRSAPNAIAASIPANIDRLEQARILQPAAGAAPSSLADLPKRGP